MFDIHIEDGSAYVLDESDTTSDRPNTNSMEFNDVLIGGKGVNFTSDGFPLNKSDDTSECETSRSEEFGIVGL